MEAQESTDPFGDVTAGERGAADVLDVLVQLQLSAMGLADELLAPLRVANLVAVGLAIVEDLDLPYGAVGVQGQRPGDELVLTDHLVLDEPALECGSLEHTPDLLGRLAHVDARVLLDGAHLLAAQLHVGGLEDGRLGEAEPLRLLDREVLNRVGRPGADHDDRRGREERKNGPAPSHRASRRRGRAGAGRGSEIVADPHANTVPAGVLVAEDPVAAHLRLVLGADADRADLAQGRDGDPPALAAVVEGRPEEEGRVLHVPVGQREAFELVVIPELDPAPPAREEPVRDPHVDLGHRGFLDGAVRDITAARRHEIGALLVLELDPRVRRHDQAVVEEVLLEDQPELERHLAGPDLGLDVEGQTDRILVGTQEAIDRLERDPVEAHRAVLLRRVVVEGDVETLGEVVDAVVLGVEVAVVDVARELKVVGQAVFDLAAELEVVIVTEGLSLAVRDPLLDLPFPLGQQIGRVGVAEERLVRRDRLDPDQTQDHERERAQGAGGDRLGVSAHSQPSFSVRRGTRALAGCRLSCGRLAGYLSFSEEQRSAQLVVSLMRREPGSGPEARSIAASADGIGTGAFRRRPDRAHSCRLRGAKVWNGIQRARSGTRPRSRDHPGSARYPMRSASAAGSPWPRAGRLRY